jgi:hypothetical protein
VIATALFLTATACALLGWSALGWCALAAGLSWVLRGVVDDAARDWSVAERRWWDD